MLSLKHIALDLPDGAELIRDISLDIPEDRVVVVTGPNGGGKTTLAKVIAGILTPCSGQILLDGEDITPLDVTQRAQRGIGFAFQQPVRFKGLTVRDLLELAAGRSLSEAELCGLLGQVGLCAPEYENRQTDASLSGGEIKRIEIATVLARGARISVFDEPEAGIDLWSFASLIDTFKRLQSSLSGSLLIISHQERILNIADEIVVIADGRVRSHGPREQVLPALMADESMTRCPLGKEEQPHE